MLIAKQADSQLTEFAAFNEGRDYPHMRRWELPFVLYRMRLPNTAAVLDCTINPLDFGERLRGLYPHVLYRHHNPIQGGRPGSGGAPGPVRSAPIENAIGCVFVTMEANPTEADRKAHV